MSSYFPEFAVDEYPKPRIYQQPHNKCPREKRSRNSYQSIQSADSGYQDSMTFPSVRGVLW